MQNDRLRQFSLGTQALGSCIDELYRNNRELQQRIQALEIRVTGLRSKDGVTTEVLQKCENPHWLRSGKPQAWGDTKNPYFDIDEVAEFLALDTNDNAYELFLEPYCTQKDAIADDGELITLKVVPLYALLYVLIYQGTSDVEAERNLYGTLVEYLVR